MPPDLDPPVGLSLSADGSLSEPVVTALREADGIADFGTDVAATLAWAVGITSVTARRADRLQEPEPLSLREEWELLASVAARDVAAARILEPHLDAHGILNEAAADGRDVDLAAIDVSAQSSWGVFAAEGSGVRLHAEQTADGWLLRGTKPWCSLAGQLTHGLVTAWVDDDQRRLFAVDLRAATVSARSGPWHARGLAQIVSAPVDFDGAPAVPVGEAGWYLRRPGFARGGAGVAACWWGGAVGLLASLRTAARRPGADQLAQVHLGRADTALWAARAVLDAAARDFEAGTARPMLATRVRSVVFDAAETALGVADHALGPLPLVADDAHARRVADLGIYLRQHHAERDLARIGAGLAAGTGAW